MRGTFGRLPAANTINDDEDDGDQKDDDRDIEVAKELPLPLSSPLLEGGNEETVSIRNNHHKKCFREEFPFATTFNKVEFNNVLMVDFLNSSTDRPTFIERTVVFFIKYD